MKLQNKQFVRSIPSITFGIILVALSLRESCGAMREYETINQFHQLSSNLFSGCHFKFFFLRGELSSGFSRGILSQFDKIAVAMEYHATLSIHTDDRQLSMRISGNKLTCLIHVHAYSDAEYSSLQQFQIALRDHINNSMRNKNWPHHFILLGKLVSNKQRRGNIGPTLIHPEYLARTSLRGIVLFINYGSAEVTLMCFLCSPETTLAVNIQLQGYNLLQKLSNELNKNFQGHFIGTMSSDQILPETSCKVQTYYYTYTFPKRSHCVLHALKRKYNYTIPFKPRNLDELFYAGDFPVTSRSLESLNADFFEWSVYLAKSDPLKLYTYQERPRLSWKVLIKPYDWEVWLVLLISAFTLAMLTVLVEDIRGLGFTPPPIFMDMLATLLDQEMSRSVQRVVNKNSRNLLTIWLLIWMLMMIVITSAYTGLLYNFLAFGIPPQWPSSLRSLLEDDEYLKLTFSSIKTFHNSTTVLYHSMVYERLDASLTSGNGEIEMDLEKLQKSIHHINSRNFMAFIVNKQNDFANKKDFSIENGKIRYPKLALIDFDDIEIIDLYIKVMYTSPLVSRGPEVVPGLELVTLWTVQKNFFTTHFSRGLGQLDQSGYFIWFNRHLNNHVVCNQLVGDLQIWRRQNTGRPSIGFQEARRKCGILVRTGKNLNFLDGYPKPLSWKQMKSIMLMFLEILPVLIITYFIESIISSLASLELTWETLQRKSTWCMIGQIWHTSFIEMCKSFLVASKKSWHAISMAYRSKMGSCLSIAFKSAKGFLKVCSR